MKNRDCIRQTKSLALPLFIAIAGVACATTMPVELINARAEYDRASAGPAAELVPADLHKARTALDSAEQSYSQDQDSQKTIDLAYIAQRTALIAEARAEAAAATNRASNAKQDYGKKEQQMATATRSALVKTREQLSDAERGQAEQAQQAGVERSARVEADNKAAASEQKAAASEKKTQEANDALAKLAAKDEARGMVITLSGSVLFRSNDSTLLPAAQTRLDQVAEALVAKNHDVVVEGYTDSKGSQSGNMTLSQHRADSVRSYLVSRGFPGERIVAKGMGPDRPVAENTSTEGRANNRRVEIVVAKESKAN